MDVISGEEKSDTAASYGETVVRVSLIIKGRDPRLAESAARAHLEQNLQAWFQEDLNNGAPYPEGSLLVWNIQAKE